MSQEVEDLDSLSKNQLESKFSNTSRHALDNRNIHVQIREKTSIDSSNQEHSKKRRSLALNVGNGFHNKPRGKPNLDSFGYHYKGYGIQQSASSSVVFPANNNGSIPIKPNIKMQNQLNDLASGSNHSNNRHQIEFCHDYGMINNFIGRPKQFVPQRSSLINTNTLHTNIVLSPGQHLNQELAPNRGSTNKVKFSADVEKSGSKAKQMGDQKAHKHVNNIQRVQNNSIAALQRSKSLSSADGLIYGFVGLGLGLGIDENDIGQLSPEIKALIKTASENPNKLNSRCLMELPSHFVKQAVEGRRYALPISRICFNIIAKEQKETFLESLLNTCRQWYQEREKLLFSIQGMKNPSRLRLISFMAFLTEMFCKLKRRQMQLRIQQEGSLPSLVFLTLLAKCCEEIVKPPIKSLTEIECLFYVLTYTGSDLENHLPQELDKILSMIRDAFLSANDSPPAIRRTLLQLIELQASHWQLPGNTVLYYYPSGK